MGAKLSVFTERWVPDAWVICMILTAVAILLCIFGAGAIGGYLACSLKKTSADISIIARGEHKQAIEQKGLKLIKGNNQETHKFNVTDKPIELPVQDFIFLSVGGNDFALRGNLDPEDILQTVK